MDISLNDRDIFRELKYSATRSSGAGGQNVNKVNTRVELRFSINDSKALAEDEKSTILTNLSSRISSTGELVITSQTERSQYRNKVKVTERFYKIIAKALKKPPERLPSQISKATEMNRMKNKIMLSQKKQERKFKIDIENLT